MAKKFTDLTADTTPAIADIMAISQSPFGAGTSKKVTLANLFFQLQQWDFAQDAGSTDTYVATLSPAPSAYVTGVAYRFKANTANTGACTINFNALGAKAIKKFNSGVATDLDDNDIRAGQWVDLIYDGTNMQMQSNLGNGSGVSGLTTGKIPKAASATSLTDSTMFVDGNGVNVGANDFIVTQSIKSGGAVTPKIYIGGNVSSAGGIELVSNNNLGWCSSSSDATTAQDIGMSRFGAGALEINKGNPTSAGTQSDLRDIILRSLTTTTGVNTAADGGGTDAYAITLSPAITAYITGQSFTFKANTANTGAATLNVNGLGAKTIKKPVGGITTDLADNDIRAGQWVDVIYDGTNMQMKSMLGNAASGGGTEATTTWAWSGDISPTISANTDDWAPTGLASASVIRANVTGGFNLTGITGGADGRFLLLINTGSFGNVLTLKNGSSSSAAANRMVFVGTDDVALHGGGAIVLWYDSTSSLWRSMNLPDNGKYYAVGNGSGSNPAFTFNNNTGNGMSTDGGNITSISSQGAAVASFYNVSGTKSFQVDGQNGVGNPGSGSGVWSGFAPGPNVGQAKWIREGTTNAGTLYHPTRTMAVPAGIPTPDLAQGNVQRHTVTGNITFGAPSNMVDGIEFTIIVKENGTGGHTVAWDSAYKWAGGSTPTHTSAANAVDIFRFWTDGTNAYERSRALDVK